MATTYTPAPGTVAARVVAWLQARPSGEYNASQIAEALGGGINGSEVAASLAPAVSAGVVFRRQRDKTSPRAPQFYSLTDHERQTREFRQNPAGWLERPEKFKAQGGTEPTPRASAPSSPPSPTVTNLLGRPMTREELGDDDAPQPMHADGTPADPKHFGTILIDSAVAPITRKDAEESGSKPGTPGAPDGVGTSSAAQAATDAPSGEGPAAADAPRARAAEFTDAKFALFCDGELMVSCGGTVIQLKAEHVQRLRRLLGGGA